MNPRKIYNPNSKTHNATMALSFFGGLMTFLPTVREFVDPEYYGPILIFVGVSLQYLRSITTKPVDQK